MGVKKTGSIAIADQSVAAGVTVNGTIDDLSDGYGTYVVEVENDDESGPSTSPELYLELATTSGGFAGGTAVRVPSLPCPTDENAFTRFVIPVPLDVLYSRISFTAGASASSRVVAYLHKTDQPA